MPKDWNALAQANAAGTMKLLSFFVEDGSYHVSGDLLHTMFVNAFIEGAVASINECAQHGHAPADPTEPTNHGASCPCRAVLEDVRGFVTREEGCDGA